MIIVWRRWGFLMLFIGVLIVLLGQFWLPGLVRGATGQDYLEHPVRTLLWVPALLIGALVTFAFWFLILRLFEWSPKDTERTAREAAKHRASMQKLVDGERAAGREPLPQWVAIADGYDSLQPRPSSSFFWLPVKFWPIVFAAGALLPLVVFFQTLNG